MENLKGGWTMRSDAMKKGLERAPHRSLFKALGLTDEEIRDKLRRVFGIKHQNKFTGGMINEAKVLNSQL